MTKAAQPDAFGQSMTVMPSARAGEMRASQGTISSRTAQQPILLYRITLPRPENHAMLRPRRWRPSVEALEDRQLLTVQITAALADGVLAITGTPGHDRILIRAVRGQLRVEGVKILADGQLVDGAPLDQVVRIEAAGLAGNDVIRLGKATDRAGVGIPAILSGGDGNDVLLGGRGDDVLRGGNGNDHLEGGPGDDDLSGDAGMDWLFGGLGNDRLNVQGDVAIGGKGADQFDNVHDAYVAIAVYNRRRNLWAGLGPIDFDPASGDVLNRAEQ